MYSRQCPRCNSWNAIGYDDCVNCGWIFRAANRVDNRRDRMKEFWKQRGYPSGKPPSTPQRYPDP